jgi:hypothetical protein
MASEHTSLKLYQGWITEASVEDVKPPAMDTRPRVFISYSHDSDEHRPNHMATLSVPDQEKVAKRTLHNLVRAAGLTAEAFVAETKKGLYGALGG